MGGVGPEIRNQKSEARNPIYPIGLNLEKLKLGIVGNTQVTVNRVKQIAEIADNFIVFTSTPSPSLREGNLDIPSPIGRGLGGGCKIHNRLPKRSDLKGLDILLICDLPEPEAAKLYKKAKKYNCLVNVEDNKQYCDFYFMSQVRRGDLVLAISTNGKSPAAAVEIRKYLEKLFPPTWAEWLEEINNKRNAWKADGISFKGVMDKSIEFIQNKGWLK